MFRYEHILTQPALFFFVAFPFLVAFSYFWGGRNNNKISLGAFNDLMEVFHSDGQIFTNIGRAVGYHAILFIRKKDAFISRVDATVMLPGHSLFDLPVSKLIREHDRLFIEPYVENKPE